MDETDARSSPSGDIQVMTGVTAYRNENGVFIRDISKHETELTPIKARISKDTGKIFIAGEMLDKIEGVIIKFWQLNKLVNDDKQIVCMGVDGHPIVQNAISESCVGCPKNKFIGKRKECKNYYILLIKSKEYSVHVKINIPPTNIRDFRNILQIPIAKVTPLTNYTAVFTPNKKERKGKRTVYYTYNIELKEDQSKKEWLEEYKEYAEHYYDYVSSNRYNTNTVVVVDQEEESTPVEEPSDDLPF